MKLCSCLNNYPVKLEQDALGGERFECYYCKFKWRYIPKKRVKCNECNLYLKKGYCFFCKIDYSQDTRTDLVFW